MAGMKHFPNVSYVDGCVRVKFDLSKYGRNLEQAQYLFGNMVLQDCKPFMPLLTGSLQQRSHVSEGGKEVVFPGPYGRFQYGGKVMVDPVTGNPWARQGAKKVLTDRPLKYTHQFNPEAQARWFEVAKAQNQTVWMEKIKDWILNGGGSGV